MKNFARIENGSVAERLDAEELPLFHPSLHWEQCPEGTQVGWLFDGVSFSAPPPPTQSEIIAKYESALDAHLDSIARQHRYDNRFTFALRAGYPGPYHAEAVAFAEWMDACNVQAFALLQSVQDGEAAMPTVENFIAGLPAFAP